MVLLGILKWFMISADKLGVGLNKLQLTITHPTWRGVMPLFASTSRTAVKHTCAQSSGQVVLTDKPALTAATASKSGAQLLRCPPATLHQTAVLLLQGTRRGANSAQAEPSLHVCCWELLRCCSGQLILLPPLLSLQS
jgi:hypothetical protein